GAVFAAFLAALCLACSAEVGCGCGVGFVFGVPVLGLVAAGASGSPRPCVELVDGDGVIGAHAVSRWGRRKGMAASASVLAWSAAARSSSVRGGGMRSAARGRRLVGLA